MNIRTVDLQRLIRQKSLNHRTIELQRLITQLIPANLQKEAEKSINLSYNQDALPEETKREAKGVAEETAQKKEQETKGVAEETAQNKEQEAKGVAEETAQNKEQEAKGVAEETAQKKEQLELINQLIKEEKEKKAKEILEAIKLLLEQSKTLEKNPILAVGAIQRDRGDTKITDKTPYCQDIVFENVQISAWAAATNSIALMRLLDAHGFETGLEEQWPTASAVAALYNSQEVMEYLSIKAGAKLIEHNPGRNSLFYAYIKNHSSLLTFLLAHTVSHPAVEATNSMIKTAERWRDIRKDLLEKKALQAEMLKTYSGQPGGPVPNFTFSTPITYGVIHTVFQRLAEDAEAKALAIPSEPLEVEKITLAYAHLKSSESSEGSHTDRLIHFAKAIELHLPLVLKYLAEILRTIGAGIVKEETFPNVFNFIDMVLPFYRGPRKRPISELEEAILINFPFYRVTEEKPSHRFQNQQQFEQYRDAILRELNSPLLATLSRFNTTSSSATGGLDDDDVQALPAATPVTTQSSTAAMTGALLSASSTSSNQASSSSIPVITITPAATQPSTAAVMGASLSAALTTTPSNDTNLPQSHHTATSSSSNTASR